MCGRVLSIRVLPGLASLLHVHPIAQVGPQEVLHAARGAQVEGVELDGDEVELILGGTDVQHCDRVF